MSSRNIFHPPFHRRILPWLYLAVFIILSPLLVFYTSGYRYNPKKQLIEKSGNLILDSAPQDAAIFLDDQATDYVTPVNIQNVTPGIHKIRFEAPNRISWEKTLEVKAERVTFADKIILWNAEPVVEQLESFEHGLFASTADKEFIGIVKQAATNTAILEERDSTGQEILSEQVIPNLAFQEIQKALLANQGTLLSLKTVQDDHLLFSLQPGIKSLNASETRIYPYQDTLIGNNSLFSSKTKTFETQAISGFSIERTSTSKDLILKDGSFFDTRYLLPSGDWQIVYVKRPYVLLHDGKQWLGLSLKSNQNQSALLKSEHIPMWLTQADIPEAAFITSNEIWTWKLDGEPELLLRQSSPLIGAEWHTEGSYLFFADQTQLYALELDNRNGRNITQLMSFDHIDDFTYRDKQLFVIGRRGNQSGLWTITIE